MKIDQHDAICVHARRELHTGKVLPPASPTKKKVKIEKNRPHAGAPKARRLVTSLFPAAPSAPQAVPAEGMGHFIKIIPLRILLNVPLHALELYF